jgi:1-acyl-sn-glycerol-3-phosphate acyltransferase
MHRLLPIETPPRRWSPRLSPGWVRFWRPFRRLAQRHAEKLQRIEVRGLEHVRQALVRGQGVLITPNHISYADPYLLHEAADQAGRPFYFMAAWQVFGTASWLKRLVLAQHGCFSVDREGTDLQAFRKAVEILRAQPHPLVVFPEGEMYHLGDRVTPFREGPAAIALAAAKKADKQIVCLPCTLRYSYLEDPTPQLLQLMDRLERALFWRPAPHLPLDRRIYRLAAGALALKEVEYLGSTSAGPLPERIGRLSDHVLRELEGRYCLPSQGAVPDRVKALRHQALQQLAGLGDKDPRRQQIARDLDDVFFVVQLFCYPGDYVAERPTIERIAETLDKFEEDVLGVPIARARGKRAGTVTFGEPIVVEPGRGKQATAGLTRLLEERVQALLDGTVACPEPVPIHSP